MKIDLNELTNGLQQITVFIRLHLFVPFIFFLLSLSPYFLIFAHKK